MKKKLKQITTITIIFLYLMPFFFIEKKVSASQNEVTNEYILGALINASQGGRSSGGSALMGRVGSHVIGGQRGSNSRFINQGIKRGGNTVAFNPSTIDINRAYDDYSQFITEGSFNDDIYIIPVNRYLQSSTDALTNSKLTNGIIFNNYYTGTSDWTRDNHIHYTLPRRFKYLFFEYSNVNSTDTKSSFYYNRGSMSSSGNVSYNGTYSVSLDSLGSSGTRRYDIYNSSTYKIDITYGNPISSLYIKNVYFSDFTSVTPDHIEVIYNEQNMITRQEFINNYTNHFNLQYDNSTNQLVQNDNYYTYNINDFSDHSVTIDNIYITNNYTNIIESENGGNVTEQLNYTSLFEKIISSIKELPQQIREKFDDFSGGGGSEPEPVEEGKGFWSSLFDAIATLVTAFSDFIKSIPQLILDLLDGLLGLVQKVVELFIPTSEQMQELSESLSGLTDDVRLKFIPITDAVNSVSVVFSSPKSIYDLTYNVQGQTVNVIPRELELEINKFKTLLNGVLVLTTFISIYKRFVGREDIIK